MSFKKYIYSKIPYLLINFILLFVLLVLMQVSKFDIRVMFFISIIWFGPLIGYMVVEFYKKNVFYKEISNVLGKLDKKYLLPEVLKKPKEYEMEVVYEILRESNREMHEHVNKYKNIQKEYREYIEAWVHEIKTPVASIGLVAENSQGTTKKTLEDENKKIEFYIEQALYYARSTDANKDYIIKEFEVKEVIQSVIRKNRREFINKKFIIDIEDVNHKVYADSKWLEFIINQIVVNSIKYNDKEKPGLKAYTKDLNDKVILNIEDNGIGISEKDLDRVFDKGFTGENGRTYGKSTGIGLYLCKMLCEKLGLGIKIKSKKGIGTKTTIIFPMGGHTRL